MTSADIAKLSNSPDKNRWPIYDLRFRGNEMITTRVLTVVPFREQIISYKNGVGTVLIGNELSPMSYDIVTGSKNTFLGPVGSVALRWDQPFALLDNQVYLSGTDGLLKSDDVNVTSVLSPAPQFTTFDSTKDASGRKLFIGTSGNNMAAVVVGTDGIAKSYTLCMPGSFVNAQFVKMSQDGNTLLISDTAQRRVLRYQFRENNKFILYQKNSDSSCSQIQLL
jgi:hypothetical protein